MTSLLLLSAMATQNSTLSVPPAVDAIAKAPNVFHTRKYDPTPLPTFADSKAKLPQPIVADHPDWQDLYWKAWELAFQHLKQPEPESGFVSNFIDPAFNQNTFQWDTCFMLMYAHYAEPTFHAIGSFDNFYAKEHEDGYICREITRKTGEDFIFEGVENTINPPLYSWVEWENYRLTGDKSRFRDILTPLVRYYLWIANNRRRADGLYWNTGLGSGADDLVRNATAYSWVDMTAQQAENAYYIARIAEQIGDKDVAKWFDGQNKELSALVNKTMWDPKTGFYYDLKQDGTPTGIKTVFGFWPMLGRITTKEQAAKLVEHLQNPNEFWRTDVVPALSADAEGYRADGQYWNGAVWAPTNFMVVKGLENYGYEDLASKVVARYLENMSQVLKDTGTIWENYAPDRAAGHGVRDMVGWSGDGPIALLIENILGIRGEAVYHKVFWRPRLPGDNGLRNLRIGDAAISLIAGKVTGETRAVTIESDKPITVVLDTGVGRARTINIQPGKTTLEVKATSWGKS